MRRLAPAMVLMLAAFLPPAALRAGQDAVTSVPMVFVPPLATLPGAAFPGLRLPDAAAGAAGAAGAAAGTPAATTPATDDTTASAAASDTSARITQVVELCRDLPDRAYTIDCVAAGLAEIAAAMPRTGDQAAARAAIAEAARDLRALATTNRDPALPRATVRRGAVASPRPVTPVVPSVATSAEAAAIVAQAQTVLLRSAPNTAAVPEYNRISAALDTTRVLLRSS